MQDQVSALDPRLALLAHQQGFVPVERLTARIYVDAARGFADWREAFSPALVRRLEFFAGLDVHHVDPGHHDEHGPIFSPAEADELRERGAIFGFTRIVPERLDTQQGRPERAPAETRLRQRLALELLRRTAEIDLLLTALNEEQSKGYSEATGLIIDALPIIKELAADKTADRGKTSGVVAPQPNSSDRADTFVQRLMKEAERLPYMVYDAPPLYGEELRRHAVESLRERLPSLQAEEDQPTLAITRRLRVINALAKGYYRASIVAKTERELGGRERRRAATLAKHPDPASVLTSGKGRIGKKTVEAALRLNDKQDVRVLVDPGHRPHTQLDFADTVTLAIFGDVDPFPFSFRFVLWWKEILAARKVGRALRGEDVEYNHDESVILGRSTLPQESCDCPVDGKALIEFHCALRDACILFPYGCG